MRVLHLWDYYAPGLFDRSFELCKDSGVEVELACMNLIGDSPGPEVRYVRHVPRQAPVRSLARRALLKLRTSYDRMRFRHLVRKTIRDFDPNLLHIHYGTTGALLAYEPSVVGRPMLISFYGFDISQALRDPSIRGAYRRLMKRRPLVHILCDEARKRAEIVGATEDRIVEANLPLPVDRYPNLGFQPGSSLRWLMPARFVEKKGHRIALEAFRRHIEEYPNDRLTCWGYGDSNWLAQLVQDYGLVESVAVVDNAAEGEFHEAYLRQLKIHNVILAPSIEARRGDDEGGPALTAVLAQVAGKPLIVSDFPGHERSIANGVEGLVVPQGDGAALANAMSMLSADRDRAKSMGQAGRERTICAFAEDAYRAALLRWYERLAA